MATRQAVGVADVAEVVDAGQVGAGHGQPSRRRAGGEQELVVGQPLAALQDHLGGGRVDRRHQGRGPQLDALFGVEALVVDEELDGLFVAPQVPLGQRGTLVRAGRVLRR